MLFTWGNDFKKNVNQTYSKRILEAWCWVAAGSLLFCKAVSTIFKAGQASGVGIMVDCSIPFPDDPNEICYERDDE